MSNNMSNIIECIKALPGMMSLKGAEESDIKVAANQLGIEFAQEFVEYAKAFGAISANGIELLGITPHKRLSVVHNTLAFRERYNDFPKDKYVIEDTGDEGILILQDCEGKIYSYIPNAHIKLIANSLRSYIQK